MAPPPSRCMLLSTMRRGLRWRDASRLHPYILRHSIRDGQSPRGCRILGPRRRTGFEIASNVPSATLAHGSRFPRSPPLISPYQLRNKTYRDCLPFLTDFLSSPPPGERCFHNRDDLGEPLSALSSPSLGGCQAPVCPWLACSTVTLPGKRCIFPGRLDRIPLTRRDVFSDPDDIPWVAALFSSNLASSYPSPLSEDESV
jgi:hypothetical protein